MVNCADADNVGLTGAILDGMRRRRIDGKGVGTLVHTNGVAVFGGLSKGGSIEDARVYRVR